MLHAINIEEKSRFQWVVAGANAGPRPLFDEPLLSNDHAVAIPSVGSLVPGWTLIVPRQPALNMRELGAQGRGQLQSMRDSITRTLTREWPHPVFEFEHGPDARASLTGCGVDQAHLHIVPLPFDLVSAASALPCRAMRITLENPDPWSAVPAHGDYLLVRNVKSGEGIVLIPRVPESQTIRRLIARQLGRPEDWNYHANDGTANALGTRKAFNCAEPGQR